MCQESTFVANIRSPAKAVGLMQLEPATARQYAKRLGITYSSKLLTTPEANIRIGHGVSGRSASRVRQTCISCWPPTTPATAASRRWMRERPGLSQEEFIDDIPFYETQGYVRKILATAEDYRRLYGADAGLSPDDEIPRS